MANTIIFDLGGVLVDLDWDRVCEPFVELSNLDAAIVRQELVSGPIVNKAMMGLIDQQGFHQTLCQRLGIELDYDEFIDIWVRLLSANKGIVPLIERLSLEHDLVLASNTDPIHFSYCLNRFGVLQYFNKRFLSYEMGLLKPAPAFFQHVLRSLNFSPNDCVFIDDRAENVDAARGVGMTGLQYTDCGQLQSDLAAVLS